MYIERKGSLDIHTIFLDILRPCYLILKVTLLLHPHTDININIAPFELELVITRITEINLFLGVKIMGAAESLF